MAVVQIDVASNTQIANMPVRNCVTRLIKNALPVNNSAMSVVATQDVPKLATKLAYLVPKLVRQDANIKASASCRVQHHVIFCHVQRDVQN